VIFYRKAYAGLLALKDSYSVKPSFPPMHRGRCLLLSLFTLLLCSTLPGGPARVLAAPTPAGMVRLRGNVPTAAVARASALGRVPAAQTMTLALALPLRDPAGLDSFLDRLYDPADPLHGHYLTPAAFTERFGPTQRSYDAVAAFARSRGLVVTHTSPGRLLLSVSGPAAAVEAAFAVHLGRYQAADGRVFHAPDADPAIPAALAGRLSAVLGLDSVGVWRSHAVRGRVAPRSTLKQAPIGAALPAEIGTDPNTGALTPSDIKAAYGLSQTTLTGAGQTLALLELDGYLPSDITAYNSAYSLPNVPLENVLLDGYSGMAGADSGEVTLDIEVMNALAPGASRILVYEAPNSIPGIIHLYNQMADDNRAKQLSSSWGLHSENAAQALQDTENVIFKKMAAQGQSFFVITGDYGAYDDAVHLSVEDPSTQPMVTAVGGTKLAVAGRGGAYQSEGAWGNVGQGDPNVTPLGAGGGGGVSTIWPIPSYQIGVPGLASTTQRNTPDVSLDADPDTGYAIYLNGQWNIFGGTSVATPLWAAYAALVNQQRAKFGEAPLGFANPTLYSFGPGGANAAKYSSAFHDPADGSTNLFYPTKPGYDNATGLGSFNGTNMLALLAPPPNTTGSAIASLSFNPNPVVGGLTVTGTVTLANPAPAAGATVTLASTDAVTVPVPPSVTVAAGQTSADFTVNTAVTTGTTVTITASYQGSSLGAGLVVNTSPTAIVPTTLSLTPASVNGGDSSTGNVTLSGPAPKGGLVVALTSSDPAAQVPASVTVPSGVTTATFPVTTSPVPQEVVATLTATAGGTSVTAPLTVLAPLLEKLVLTPPTLPGGQTSTGTLTLTFAAPAAGAVVALSSDNPAIASVPATVTIPAGGTTATFTVTTKAVPKTLVATIKATLGGLSQTAKLEVRSARLSAVSVAPVSLTGGAPAVGTVTLDSPVAVAAGLVVALTSSDPSGKVPATVTVPLGATTATFPVTTSVVAAPVADTLTASLDGFNKTAALSVQPIQVTSLALTPPAVIAGVPSVGTVTVNAPAPPGGLLVTLTQTGAAETLPATATVPAGATTATFPVGTPIAGTVTVAAVVGGQTRTATLTVTTAVGTSFPAGLNMISAPYDYAGQPLDALFGYAGVRLATEDASVAQYAFTPQAPADALRLGRGYFVKLPKALTLTSVGTPADPTTDFPIALPPGWNMIGDPFLVPVALSATHVSSAAGVLPFSAAVSATPLLVSSLLYSYSPSANGGKGGYVTLSQGGSLQPGAGYWIYAYSAVTLVIPHPGQ